MSKRFLGIYYKGEVVRITIIKWKGKNQDYGSSYKRKSKPTYTD